MIRIHLDVSFPEGLSPHQEELVRAAIRKSMIPFLFQVLDEECKNLGKSVDHHGVVINGEIKCLDDVALTSPAEPGRQT